MGNDRYTSKVLILMRVAPPPPREHFLGSVRDPDLHTFLHLPENSVQYRFYSFIPKTKMLSLKIYLG